jgi:hypothetical protein
MTTRGCLTLLAGIALSWAALADQKGDENKDLELIPQARQAPVASSENASAAAGATHKIYLENAFTQSWLQGGLVPSPAPPPPWEERLLLDVRKEWRLGRDVGLVYSGRLNLRESQDLDFPSHENVTNDLREAYAGWEPFERTFVEAGRINVKSGVALGLNPTDFFKTRAVVEPLSVDPVVLREDRLGTLMVRAQRIWAGGSLTAAFAPAVASASPIYSNIDLRSFDPMFDRTNSRNRFLLKSSVDIGSSFSPEFLLYHEGARTRWGVNLTQAVSQSVVVYGEWSGGRRASLIDDALDFGRRTATLPPGTSSPLPDDAHSGFRNQLALGASYTTAQPKITFNLEFNYNQAGFSGVDWNNWFQAGRGLTNGSPLARELWFIRNYALDQQEQVSRSVMFLRADWVDAFVPKLELTGFVDADLADGSARVQLAADYYLSDRWTVGALVLADLGARRSDFGSLPQAGSVLLKVARYF